MTQQRVAELVAEGLTDKQIAQTLAISPMTVSYHIARLCDCWKIDKGRNIRVQITRHVLKAA